ncbi:serine hydrolase domain-containing protein [Woodsholea maritima]|uniref:serine hydrolase domain-containing protein n=1 Tax=Woodsholea maritima TaxID=240237 RepID=UPI00036153D7|nr:serine hydrolase domain-containing protein [Woodsholea maritima]
MQSVLRLRFLCAFLAITAIGLTYIPDAFAQSEDPRSLALAETGATYARDHEFDGVVLVAEHGSVLYEGAYGEADRNWSIAHTPQSKFLIASMTKSQTAILVMQLVETGELSLEGVIGDYLPDYPASYKDRITLHQLLSHRSGIPHYPQVEGWMEGRFRTPIRDDDFLAIIAGMALNFEPGSESRYSNSNYFILGKIIEAVTGERYEDVLQTRLYDVLGMDASGTRVNGEILPQLAQSYVRGEDGEWVQSGYINMDLFVATASVYSTAHDLLKLDQALYGTQLVSEASKARLFDRETPYGWFVGDVPLCNGARNTPVIAYNGGLEGFVSFMMRLPEEHRSVIVLSNSGPDYDTMVGFAAEMAEELYCGG